MSGEALVIGGGPAGASVATLLARQGREVVLAEARTGEHDKVCGEFLSAEAVGYLSRLGIVPAALGAASICGVRLARRKCIAECELPFPAISLTRRKLDEALLTLAAAEGVDVRRGARVDDLHCEATGWCAQMAGGEALRAKAVFLATGKHDLGGWRRPPGRQNDLVAFKMYFSLASAQTRALSGWIELCLFPHGYAGLQLTEDGNANLCLLVNRQTLKSCDGNWPNLLAHILSFSDHLALRLQGAKAQLERPLALSSIPYGMLLRDADAGLWRLGDQAAVIPSFTGDGISIALHSAEIGADLYLNGRSPAEHAARMHRQLRRSVALATGVSKLMIGASALAPLLRVCPPLLAVLAEQTRVPQAALVS